MKNKVLTTGLALLFSGFVLGQNPFESIGQESNILTLTNGKYPEVFENDTLQIIGDVVFNTVTNKIEYFIERDTLYSEATMEAEIVSRWLSRDPLAAKFPSHSPYNFVENNPILNIDPDGRFLLDVHKRIARNAFGISKLGLEVSDKVLAFRNAIAGRINNNYTGSVVAPDVRSLPKYIGGGGQKSNDAFHFDNMNYSSIVKNYNAISSRLNTLVASYKSGNLNSEELGEQVGEYYHAIQDFYSHSNYIELYESVYGQTEFKDIPTIQEAMSNEKYGDFAKLLKSDLKTGTYPGEGEGSHHDMNHDLGFGSKYTYVSEVKGKKVTWNSKAAEAVATKATKEVNDKIESVIDN